jgi:hypothetical protein
MQLSLFTVCAHTLFILLLLLCSLGVHVVAAPHPSESDVAHLRPSAASTCFLIDCAWVVQLRERIATLVQDANATPADANGTA